MRPRRILTTQETAQILDHAVQANELAVLSLWQGDEWYSLKSRFLERDPQRKFVVLDVPLRDDKPVDLALGQYVGVSFRYKSRKVMFTTVLEAKGRYVADANTKIAAARYRWPESLTELQRRAYYRTPVPEGISVLATMWAGGFNARSSATNTPLSVITGDALDLSCGGTLVRINSSAPPEWHDNQTVGLELHLPDGREPMVLDAYYRGGRRDETNRLCAALQFVGLEMSAQGRTNLQRLARCVQRFHRLSLAPDLRSGTARLNFG